jgi:hypothetical protein
VKTVKIPEKGLWYRVQVGRFAEEQEAVLAKGKIESRYGVIPLIVGL